MITRILVGLDGSELAEAALPVAERLARAGRGELLLVRAVTVDQTGEQLMEVDPSLIPTAPVTSWERHPEEPTSSPTPVRDAAVYLNGIATRLNSQGFGCEILISAGDPAEVLLDEARRLGADIIVVGTHARSEVGRVIHGSVAEAVLARSRVPVLMVHAEGTKGHQPAAMTAGPIVVPLDGSPVAEAALPWASQLASMLSMTAHLIRVVRPFLIVPGDEIAGVDVTSTVVAEDEDERAAKEYLESMADPLRRQGIRTTTEVVVGQPAFAIARVADEQQASTIVMATHGRSGLARTLLGSVAMRTLSHSHIPTLLVRPDEILRKLSEREATHFDERTLGQRVS